MENIKNTVGAIPFIGSWLADQLDGSIKAFDTTDLKDAMNYITQFSLDLNTNIAQNFKGTNSSAKAIKSTGRILGVLGIALTINDFWETFEYNSKIDRIIEYHFIGPGKGNYMTGETKGQLLARYIYATDRINKLLEEGLVTHITSKTKVKNRNFFDPIQLERLKYELSQIK
ncbi:hypothetical protein ACF3MZ_02305 [Paenibacillaceae bacterium WGS1546]|uniref:hypothetical protein n=1 Tax=Cohnella sp. WGS1546 TaxID=3366810 RepID=UPI00372CF6FC